MNGGQQPRSPYQQQQQYGGNGQLPADPLIAPIKASVPRYCFADETFWFVVECQMEDGRHWELSRLYQDFYDLQINLIQENPLEAGNVKGHERTLPFMPGPVTYVTDNISNGRRANLDEYMRNLLKLGPHITRSNLVRQFFRPRNGDYEIDPNVGTDDYRLSSGSQDNNGNAPLMQTPSNQQQRPGTSNGHSRTLSTATTPAPGGNGGPVTQIKIKVWFEPDNCVVIRMPPSFTYRDLYKKLKERRALERFEGEDENTELEVCYRDEGEARLFPCRNDDELREGMERNERFTLSVRAAK